MTSHPVSPKEWCPIDIVRHVRNSPYLIGFYVLLSVTRRYLRLLLAQASHPKCHNVCAYQVLVASYSAAAVITVIKKETTDNEDG